VPDETDPLRKNYGFKERVFQRDERPPSDSRPPVTTQELAKLAGPVTRSEPVASNVPKPGDPNDVHAILQQNRTAEKKSGGDNIEIRKVSSRRKRDYWLVFLGTEIFFGAIIFAGIRQSNPFFLVFGLAGAVILGLSITWVMWQLMDKY